MSQQKAIGMAAVAVGIVLLIFGFDARDSFASDVSEIVDGTPTDRSIWLLAGGAALLLGGLALAFARRRA